MFSFDISFRLDIYSDPLITLFYSKSAHPCGRFLTMLTALFICRLLRSVSLSVLNQYSVLVAPHLNLCVFACTCIDRVFLYSFLYDRTLIHPYSQCPQRWFPWHLYTLLSSVSVPVLLPQLRDTQFGLKTMARLQTGLTANCSRLNRAPALQ